MKETLWSNDDRSKFYVIPDDAVLPSGTMRVHTITGRRQDVSGSALVPYQVTQAEAQQWLEGQFGKVLDGARGVVEKFVDRLTGADQDPIGALNESLTRLDHLITRIQSAAPPIAPAQIAAAADRIARLQLTLRKIADGNAPTNGSV